MPTLPTQSFSTMVSNVVAGIQGRASKLLNFSQGSTLRAIVEGFAGIYLWFQALVLQLQFQSGPAGCCRVRSFLSGAISLFQCGSFRVMVRRHF